MAGTQNTYLLLWITGAYLFCGGNRVLAHDGSTHTDVSIEHHQEISDLFQKLPHKNDTKNLMQWKDVIEMRNIHYTKWRMEERVHSYTAKKRVPHTEQRSKKYTIMVPEKRTKIVCVTRYRWETRTREQTLQASVPKLRTKEIGYTVMVPKEKICTYSVLIHDTLTEQKTERYHVPVPYSVSKQVPITVRRCIVEQVQNGTTSQSGEIHSGDPNHVKKAA